jgi:hypothetical protein
MEGVGENSWVVGVQLKMRKAKTAEEGHERKLKLKLNWCSERAQIPKLKYKSAVAEKHISLGQSIQLCNTACFLPTDVWIASSGRQGRWLLPQQVKETSRLVPKRTWEARTGLCR